MAFSRVAMKLSVVCDYGISRSYSLFLIKHFVRIRKWINIMVLLTSEALVEDEPVKQPNSYAYPSAAGIDTYHH